MSYPVGDSESAKMLLIGVPVIWKKGRFEVWRLV
jgi:hypothetical protein